MFGFVNQFLAGLRGERVGKSLLVLRIACLDVVIGDGIEEVLLLFGQLAVESAAVGQPLVVMGVGRVVRLSAAPVGLQSFLYGLVAHEGYIELTLCLIQVFGHAKVFVGYIKPVCYFVCCHNRCRYRNLLQKYDFFCI